MQDNAMSKWLSPLMGIYSSFASLESRAPITAICLIAGATFNSGWDYHDRRTCIFDHGECDGN